MPVLLRSRSPLNPPRTPILVATLRRRRCCQCQRKARVTLFSPSMFYGQNIRAGMMAGINGTEAEASDGQCCIRCTRGLRSP